MGNQSSNETQKVNHFSKKLQKKFQLAEDEILIDSFLCALINKILIQGELYLTPSKMIFHSPFNSRTLFGETVIIMEYHNINYIDKTHGVFGLQNSIYIETQSEEFTFTSFLFRDQAYNVMNQSWSNFIDSITHPLKSRDSVLKSSTPRKAPKVFSDDFATAVGDAPSYESQEKSPAELLALRRRKVLDSMPNLSSYRTTGYKASIENTDIHQFFSVILSDENVSYKGKNYSCWWQLFGERTGAPEPSVIAQWEPRPPQNFRSTKQLMNYEAPFCKRMVKGKKPLKGGGWFTPSFIEFEETQKLYVLDQKEIVVTSEVRFLTKFPFSDTFEYLNCYLIKENDDNEVSIEYRYSMNFIKYCLFQGTIERQTQEEQTNNGIALRKIMAEFKSDNKFKVPPKEDLSEKCRSDSWEEAQAKLVEQTKEAPVTPQEVIASLAPAPVELVAAK